MMVKLNGCIFQLNMMNYLKQLVIFGIKQLIVLKKNLNANSSTIKSFENPNKIFK